MNPNVKIVFNAVYDDKHTYPIKIFNGSGRRIGWAIKTTNTNRLEVDPACGVFDLKKVTLMAVSCDVFDYGHEDTNNDRITVEWCNTPDGAAMQFRREWFQGELGACMEGTLTTAFCYQYMTHRQVFALALLLPSKVRGAELGFDPHDETAPVRAREKRTQRFQRRA
ncbi:unnamed protein product [Nippostrongylus brasiliensis]|uniref:Major sperm protein n=1 Tax=Nippostrongylus brasiliensis TaxID=27835 RepID=A0A0N4Y328_NIPBR|nr:unnamed protein product [Nippostrongylus brasiliensis]